MGRMPCCAKEGLNRGAWSAREDRILTNYINIHGEGKWRDLPQKAGLRRCGKSCRLRWLNYLRPDIKRGNISKEEEELIIKLHRLLGNRWSLIAGRLPGRTDNEIKNYWNTNLSRKLLGKKTEKQPRKIKDMNPAGGSLVDVAELKVDTTHVIRTKAVRCTKVFLPQEEGNWINKKSVELSLRGDSPLSSAQQVDDSSNFLMDFDIGELLVSDVLNSDFLQVCGDGIQEANNSPGGDNGNKSSLCSDYPFSAHKMVAENGMECDPLQPNAALELKRLSSFLDLEDERMEQQ